MDLLKLLLILIFATLILSCSEKDDGIYFDPINESKTTYTDLEIEILDQINFYRDSIGLKELEELNVISAVALSHSKYMAQLGKISHDNFENRSNQLIVNANAKYVGENVGYGYTSAKGVVDAWIKSDKHRAVIESSAFTHFGISTEKNYKGRNYFTQIFIKK